LLVENVRVVALRKRIRGFFAALRMCWRMPPVEVVAVPVTVMV
jgi:hypothetical protein